MTKQEKTIINLKEAFLTGIVLDMILFAIAGRFIAGFFGLRNQP